MENVVDAFWGRRRRHTGTECGRSRFVTPRPIITLHSRRSNGRDRHFSFQYNVVTVVNRRLEVKKNKNVKSIFNNIVYPYFDDLFRKIDFFKTIDRLKRVHYVKCVYNNIVRVCISLCNSE